MDPALSDCVTARATVVALTSFGVDQAFHHRALFREYCIGMHIQGVGGAEATEVGLGQRHLPDEHGDNDGEGEVEACADL